MNPKPSIRKSSTQISKEQLPQPLKPQYSILQHIKSHRLTLPTADSPSKYYQIQLPNGPAIRIYFLTHSIVRIRMSFQSETNPHRFKEQSYSLVMTAWQDRFDELLKDYRKNVKAIIDVKFQEREVGTSDRHYYFQTNQLIGKIYVENYGLELMNKYGVVLYKDLRGRAYKRDNQGRIYHYNEIDPQNDYFYGFGQNTGKLNKKGHRIRQAPHDSLGYNTEQSTPMYKHIPFYIKANKKSKHAIGLYYNNSYESVFDMGCEKSGYWPRYSYFCADGGDVDLFLINGPSMKKVIQRYTDLTGKTAFVPMQALGYLGSTMYYAELEQNCDRAIQQFIEKCIKENVPISNFHLSSGYTLSQNKQIPKRNVFTWNSYKFPNPKQFFNNMKNLGVSVSPNVKPALLTLHHLYEQFTLNNVFIKDPLDMRSPYIDRWWGGEGSFIDFTNKKSREIWKKYLKQQIISKGTTSIWNDNNQYDSIDNKTAVCSYDYDDQGKTNQFKIKNKQYGNVEQLQTVQALLMAHITQQAIKQENYNVRPYIVTRSGCAGIQRYASSWSGDNYTSWKTLQNNISTVLNVGLSGIANYGCDIGGFWGPAPSGQLFLRWVQHGIFQPRFCIHSCNSDNTVTQPWMFQKYSRLISKTIRFRYLLLPYLYSLLYFSHIKGRPIMRPLVYEFQDFDFEACCQQDKLFMLGPYMLVANILQPMNELQLQAYGNSYIKNQTDFINFPEINQNLHNCVQLNESKLNYQNPYSSFNANNPSQLRTQYAYKQVYLPKGCNWYSWNGRQKYQGGSTITIKVGLQSIPIFVKDKSIIPLAIKFGKKQHGLSLLQMNKQNITGLYIKIAYDNQNYAGQKLSYTRMKNNLEFLLFQDDGVSTLSKNEKQKEKQGNLGMMSQSTLGNFQRIYQNRLNVQIPTNSSYLITKITVKNPQIKQNSSLSSTSFPQFDHKILLINISRQGNLQSDSIATTQRLILQIKSIQICPVWITINTKKCRQVLYEQEWRKWNPSSLQKLRTQSSIDQNHIQLEEYGCWYYDHEKGAAILKINKYLVKPLQPNIDRYRCLEIKVCKDKMIQFSKEYAKINGNQEGEEDMGENRGNDRSKDKVIKESEMIQEEIVGEEKKKIKQRKRIIIKDKQK